MDSLVQEELPEVDDRRLVGREKRGQPRRHCPRRGGARSRCRDSADRSRDSATKRGERLFARLRTPLLDVHSRGHLVNAVDVAADVLDDLSDMRRSDENGTRIREHLSPPRLELWPPAHRVLELRPMRLHGIPRSRRVTDRAPEQHVVAEHEIRRQVRSHGGRVYLDPGVELLARAVLEQLDAIALVLVEHEDREQASDIGSYDSGAADVEALGMRLLAEHGDVVPRARPLARELARVDVRPRPTEQVPVPEENPHRSDGIPSRVPLSRLRLGFGLVRRPAATSAAASPGLRSAP